MTRTRRFTPALLAAFASVASASVAQTAAPAAAPATQAAPAAQAPAAQAPAAAVALPAPGTTTITGSVQALDVNARRMTIKTEQGALVTLGLPEAVTQLGDIKIGDVVTVSYLDGQVTKLAKVPPGPPPAPGWIIESKDKSAFVRIGFLAQPQYEALETPSESGYQQNFFLRRMRLLVGGQIAKRWTFFFETDSPNLGKSTQVTAPGAKEAGDIYIQDAFFTFEPAMAFKVDVGMILVPMSYNHTQSAATLLPVDYGPYTFIENGPLQERVGRDYGVQLRGYPLKQRLEYRVGVFQGLRGAEARNDFRFTGRAQVNFLQADTGFFHLGTAQGTRQIFSVGGFYDTQEDYYSTGFDTFFELNVKKMFGVTGQFNWVHTDGGDLVATLPKQDTMLVEFGVHLAAHFTPFLQWSTRDYDNDAINDTDIEQVGVAYWFKGHQRNLKVGVGRQHVDGGVSRTQVQVQFQWFYY